MESKNIISPISVLNDIQDKKIAPETLPKETRQLCAELLLARGATPSEIAELLKVSIRTVHRDLCDIKKANAIDRSPEFVTQHVGQLIGSASSIYSNLLKISNSKNAKCADKIEAGHKAWLVLKDLSLLFIHLGYLPNAPTEINANFNHAFAQAPDIDEVTNELSDLEGYISESNSVSDDVIEDVKHLKSLLTISQVSLQIKSIHAQIQENEK